MPARTHTLDGEALLLQFCRQGRLIEEKLALNPLDAVRVAVLIIAHVEHLQDGDQLKIRKANP